MTYPPSRCLPTVVRRTTLSAFNQIKGSAHLTACLALLTMAGILTDPLRKSKIIFNLVFWFLLPVRNRNFVSQFVRSIDK